jgi:hypothetical protein
MRRLYIIVICFFITVLSFGQNNEVGKWQALPDGPDSVIYRLYVFKDTMYAGGEFTHMGNKTVPHLAKWDGKEWLPVGLGADDNVYAFEEFNGQLIIGGAFDSVDGKPANHLARWDGHEWHRLGKGLGANDEENEVAVGALCKYKDALYAGGNFIGPQGAGLDVIAKWDGKTWSSVGGGLKRLGPEYSVISLTVNNGKLYVSGVGLSLDGKTPRNILTWDGMKWDTVGSCRFDGPVFTTCSFNNDIIAGGNFVLCDSGKYVSRLHNNQWVSASISGAVSGAFAFCIYNKELYAGGYFEDNGESGQAVDYSVAKWNGNAWVPVGDLNDRVTAIGTYHGKLYISSKNMYFGAYVK